MKKNKPDHDDRWQITFDAINDAICLMDIKNRFLKCNKTMSKLLGKPNNELVGKTCWKIVHGTSKPIKGCPIVRMRKTLKRETLVLKLKDRWVKVAVDPILNENKKLVGAVHIISDITEMKNAGEALKESEERYRALIENASDFIYMVDNKGRILSLNKSAVKLFGKEPRKVVGKSIFDFFPEEIAAHFLEAIKTVFNTGKGRISETKMIVKAKRMWISANLSPVRNRKGDVVAVMGITRDITEKKKSEQALKESEEKWSSLTENTDDIIMVVNSKGVVQYINKTTLPYHPKESIGKRIYDYVPKGQHNILRKSLGNVFKTGKPDSYEVSPNIPKIGTLYFYTKVVPVKHSKKVVNAILISTNITEQKKSEQALKENERRFQDVANNTLEWIWEVDTEGKYTYTNTMIEEILGYKPEEILKKHFYDFFHPKEREMLKKAAFEAFARKEPFRSFVNRNVHKNGNIVWLSTSGIPVLDDKGKLMGYRGADIDITKQKEAEQTLKKRAEELERFTKLAVGRELKMVELKYRIKELESKLKKR
ncbi:PAS domain S-box protein [Candidatus Woesearchaeota archaeon]|nr:PAS domain S-box protein [Candidatus Woesearchaeota archaeon]